MIHAVHLVFTAYGFWLPNDPRGSGSMFVGSETLFMYGPATKVNSKRSVAHDQHDHLLRVAAKEDLKYPPVLFTGLQAQCIGLGFRDAIAESGYICHACAIMPDHVHFVVRRHPRHGKKIIGHLKSKATMRLHEAKLWTEDRTPWGENGWCGFLESPSAVCGAIEYASDNPRNAGLPEQRWTFVVPYEEE